MHFRRLAAGLALIAVTLTAGCAPGGRVMSAVGAGSHLQGASPDDQLHEAEGLLYASRYADAERAYRALLASHPDDGRTHAAWALFLSYRHRFDEALAEAERADGLSPHDATVVEIVCRVRDWSGRLGAAVEAGRQAVSLAPHDVTAHLYLSEALADNGDLPAARTEMDAAASDITASASSYQLAELERERANLAHDVGDATAQAVHLAAALRLQPGWLERREELIAVDLAAGHPDRARDLIAPAVAELPDDLTALESLGNDAFLVSDYPDARSIWARARTAHPTDPDVLTANALIALAADRSLDSAEADLIAALTARPSDRGAASALLAIARYLRHDEARGRSEIAAALAASTLEGPTSTVQPVTDPDRLAAADAQRALALVNAQRATAGLAPVVLDQSLGASATQHAWYWLFNNADPSAALLGIHQERNGMLGYRGTFAWQRAMVAGYPDDRVGEDITHRGDVTLAVSDWVDSVYHRFPIMRPDLTSIGFASAALGPLPIDDMEFGFGGSPGVTPVAYPADQQRSVPAVFLDNELPDPVPTGAPRTTGYPVTVTFPVGRTVAVHSFTLTASDGTPLDGYRLDPSLATENSASLLPRATLEHGQRYTAAIAATIDGHPWTRTWSFAVVT